MQSGTTQQCTSDINVPRSVVRFRCWTAAHTAHHWLLLQPTTFDGSRANVSTCLPLLTVTVARTAWVKQDQCWCAVIRRNCDLTWNSASSHPKESSRRHCAEQFTVIRSVTELDRVLVLLSDLNQRYKCRFAWLLCDSIQWVSTRCAVLTLELSREGGG